MLLTLAVHEVEMEEYSRLLSAADSANTHQVEPAVFSTSLVLLMLLVLMLIADRSPSTLKTHRLTSLPKCRGAKTRPYQMPLMLIAPMFGPGNSDNAPVTP